MAKSSDRSVKFSDDLTAYVVLPFLTIIIKKGEKEVMFKMGSKNRGIDYEWFKDCIVFLYDELNIKRKEKND